MPLASIVRRRPLEYSIIHEAKPAGPAIGHYGGKPIAASIVDGFGRLYKYAGLAPRRWDGELDGAALRPGEFILLPGLVYSLEKRMRT